jgi:hypothetical protein
LPEKENPAVGTPGQTFLLLSEFTVSVCGLAGAQPLETATSSSVFLSSLSFFLFFYFLVLLQRSQI